MKNTPLCSNVNYDDGSDVSSTGSYGANNHDGEDLNYLSHINGFAVNDPYLYTWVFDVIGRFGDSPLSKIQEEVEPTINPYDSIGLHLKNLLDTERTIRDNRQKATSQFAGRFY